MDDNLRMLIDAVTLSWEEWFHTAQKILIDGPAPRLVTREAITRDVALRLTDMALAAAKPERELSGDAISGCGALAGNSEDILVSTH